jgi:hypothetical protein
VVGAVQNREIIETGSGHCSASEAGWAQIECKRDLPEVPVRLDTQLLMELKVHERCVDLREVSQLVLRDIGAALRIFHCAAKENPSPEDRPRRIEDCISILGLQCCLETLCSEGTGSGTRSGDFIETWRHATEVAECCKQLASEPAATTNPEEAYLVGLFHQLYSLPVVLGWDSFDSTSNAPACRGLRMAQDWSLPRCVQDYFIEIHNPAQEQRWSGIVQRAHEMTSSSPSGETSIEI